MCEQKVIILLSGKRKCGKDFISDKLYEKLTDNVCSIVRISEPIKGTYAKTHNLDLAQLMSDGPYKENYRLDMIKWSEKIRNENYGYFCKDACVNAPNKTVWIVSDIRRKTDIKWFRENYGDLIKTVRITANLDTRKERGWKFTEGVDDGESECNLDDVQDWDLVLENNSSNQGEEAVENLFKYIYSFVS